MATEEDKEEMKEEVQETAAFDPTKKKKKKKVTIVLPEEQEEKLVEKTENMSVSDVTDSSFVGLKKKKKKPVVATNFNDDDGEGVDRDGDQVGEGEGEQIMQQFRNPWEGNDRDYSYDELIKRFRSILFEDNPLLAGNRKRTVLPPPQVLREGTKKTVYVNFIDTCKMIHRQPEHVINFFLVEMGTSGNLDGQQRLSVKGRFTPKNFESILRRYLNDYVICLWCKSSETILARDKLRLFTLRCEQCGAFRTVGAIKQGYVAQVGRRNNKA